MPQGTEQNGNFLKKDFKNRKKGAIIDKGKN